MQSGTSCLCMWDKSLRVKVVREVTKGIFRVNPYMQSGTSCLYIHIHIYVKVGLVYIGKAISAAYVCGINHYE